MKIKITIKHYRINASTLRLLFHNEDAEIETSNGINLLTKDNDSTSNRVTARVANEIIQINFAKRLIKTLKGGKIWANSTLHETSYFIRVPVVNTRAMSNDDVDLNNVLHIPNAQSGYNVNKNSPRLKRAQGQKC